MRRRGAKYDSGLGKASVPEKVNRLPPVWAARVLKAAALVVAKYTSRSTNHTKTRILLWTARSINGWRLTARSGSSMCGVMNSTARFMPWRAVCMLAISSASVSDCRLGVVLRKSGAKEPRLLRKSVGLAWLMTGPEMLTRLMSSGMSAERVCAQPSSTCTRRWKREIPCPSRTSRAGPGLMPTTICAGRACSVSFIRCDGLAVLDDGHRSLGCRPVAKIPRSSNTSSSALTAGNAEVSAG